MRVGFIRDQGNKKSNMTTLSKGKTEGTAKVRRMTQTFTFNSPNAMSVQLVGGFTDWQQKPINMRQVQDGVWQTTIELEPGLHPYRLLVDGRWFDDPQCFVMVPNPCESQDAICQAS
jgi:1,4-alpha-glucan branching enzyme